jgi:hypothetical protein
VKKICTRSVGRLESVFLKVFLVKLLVLIVLIAEIARIEADFANKRAFFGEKQ